MRKIMNIRLLVILSCLLQIVVMMKNCPWGADIRKSDFDNDISVKVMHLCNYTITRASMQILCSEREYEYTCKGKISKETFHMDASVLHENERVTITCKVQRKVKKIDITCEKESAPSNSFSCGNVLLQTDKNCVLEVSCSQQSVVQNCSTTTTTTSLAESTYSRTASVTAITSTSSATTNSLTSTSGNTPTSTSENTDTSDTNPSSSTGTLAGGIIGGLFGGVCITVLVIVVWWKCCRKRLTDRVLFEDKKRDSQINLDLNPAEASDNSVSAVVPDVINTSRGQGDYTYISEEELDREGIYSMGKAFPKTDSTSPKTNQVPVIQNKGEDHDTYNRLGSQLEGSNQKAAAYNRIGEPHNTNGNHVKKEKDANFPSTDYFVLESSPGNQDTYNKLRAKDESTGQQIHTYNRIGKPDRNQKENDSDVPQISPENQDTYNRLGEKNEPADHHAHSYNRLEGSEQICASQDVKELDSPDYFILKENSVTETQDTYDHLKASKQNQ